MSFFLYLLKVSCLSGLLLGYYRLFLHNKGFHSFNRYYLLGAALGSLVLPLIPVPVMFTGEQTLAFSTTLHKISPGIWNERTTAITASQSSPVWHTWETWMTVAYILIAGYLGRAFLRQLRYIRQLPGKYPREKMGEIDLFLTREPGTPFSFFKSVFWNEQLDIDSTQGRQILQHELYHIRQRHSLDLLLLKPLLILCWPNPFFHLLYREIRTIHEFLADQHAISENDRYDYAELLVWQMIHVQPPSLVHPFFQSPIKRRITMITQFKASTSGYTSRIMVLPLAFLLLCAFAGKIHRKDPTIHPKDPHPLTAGISGSPVTVIIDAGHGGTDAGAIASNGQSEKDINLALALKVKQLSPEYNINVVLTRDHDELAGNKTSIRESLAYRTDMAKENRADLFISLHTDASGGNAAKGISIFVSHRNSQYSQCVKLGSAMIDALKQTYPTFNDLKESQQGIWVLRQSTMPAILILCGNINDPKDFTFITDDYHREQLARQILEGIQRYESQPH